jgi:cytochrome c553
MRSPLAVAGLTVLGGIVGAVLLAVFLIWGGVYDVAADTDHPQPVAWLIHEVMLRSVAAHAGHPPRPDLDDPALIRLGAAHFDSGCADCHGAPGHLASPIALGMEPPPPPLYGVGQQFSPDELYWIVHNGIKMTAMPAWPAPDRGDEVWAMVAFLEHMTGLSAADYAALAGTGATPSSGFLPGRSHLGFDPAQCTRCHGESGQGGGPLVPQIAGLSAAYIRAQLQAFHDGGRPSGIMEPIAAEMNTAAIAAAATYFAQQRRVKPEAGAVDPETLASGAAIAAGKADGVPSCFKCHQPAASKRAPEIPDLMGQPASYLQKQLELYAFAIRKGTPDADKMAKIARALTTDQMQAVSAYLASLPPCGDSASCETRPPR